MFCSSEETSDKAPSAVEITLVACVLLLTACWMPEISALRLSVAIKPAGSSAPLLMRKPVLRRCSVLLRVFCELASPFCAISDATLVLIRAIAILRDCEWQAGHHARRLER